MRATTLITLALLMLPVLAQAQDGQESEYANNALRVKYSLFGTKIVQGVDDTKIAGMGWFASDIDFLSERDDQIGITFKSYRSKKNLSGTMYLLSIAALIGSIVTYDSYDSGDSGSSEALFWGGFGLAIGGGMVNVSANESLSQSVWMYNSTLETMGR